MDINWLTMLIQDNNSQLDNLQGFILISNKNHMGMECNHQETLPWCLEHSFQLDKEDFEKPLSLEGSISL